MYIQEKKLRIERVDFYHLMASFTDTNLPAKRKRTTNPKLLDDDNISQDAIKRRKTEALKTSSSTTASTSKVSDLNTTSVKSSRTNLSKTPTRQASVETVADENDITCHNAGQPTRPNFIIESTDEENEAYSRPSANSAKKAPTKKKKAAESEPDTCEDESPKESDDDELSKSSELTHNEPILINLQPVCKRIGDRKYMPFFILKSRSNTSKVASVTNLPVMPKTVRERGRIHVSCDGSWIQKTKRRPKPSVCTPSIAGAEKLLTNPTTRTLLNPQDKR
jgi:hypothetical protein